MKRRIFLKHCAALPVVATLLPRSALAKNSPQILTSFSILESMVKEIAPLHFNINTLVSFNADAHVFNPKPGDIRKVKDADLIFFNGLGFEGWMNRLAQSAGYKGLIVETGTSIKKRQVNGRTDPHAWQNLENGALYAKTIGDALVKQYPQHRAEIEKRTQQYIEQIQSMHSRVLAEFAGIEIKNRKVITSHDAFAYFGEAYGVEFHSPQGWSTHHTPSAAAIGRLIRLIKKQEIKAVFLENISDAKQIEQITRETGVRIGGTLYSDALSEPSGPANTYLNLFKHNASTILNGLKT